LHVPGTGINEVEANAGSISKIIVNDDEESHFPQLATRDNVRTNMGVATVTTPAAATFFDCTITHGLGGTPEGAVATANHGSYFGAIQSMTSTQIVVRFSHYQGTSTDPGDFSCYWWAWRKP